MAASSTSYWASQFGQTSRIVSVPAEARPLRLFFFAGFVATKWVFSKRL
jgi:hypothetical protein